MEARPGGHVVIGVGVMYAVQSPKERYGVDHDVLQPDDEIQCDHRQRHGKDRRHLEMIEDAPAVFGAEGSHAGPGQRKNHAQQHRIERHQSEIG